MGSISLAELGVMMSEPVPSSRSAIDHKVDDLLARWHDWHSGYKLTAGHSGVDSTCREALSDWSAYDRENGVTDAYSENQIMLAVDRAIDNVPDEPDRRWHTMILFEARNLWSQAEVWSSMRLPEDPEEFEVLRIEARNKLLIQLQREGCIGA